VPGVAAVAEEADEISLAGKGSHIAMGADPAFARAYNLDWQQGSNSLLADLGAKDAVMEQTSRRARAAGRRPLPGHHADRPQDNADVARHLQGRRVRRGLHHAAVELATLFGKSTDTTLYVVRDPGTSLGTVQAGIDASISAGPGMSVKSHDDLKAEFEADAQDVTSMFYAMLALSVIISIFGRRQHARALGARADA
jgi:hypothetical protein